MAQTKIEKLLAFFTHKIIAKYRPVVIGITGSVGKTSTRHAIAAALSAKYFLREPQKNYNNTIGIPLTVIGVRGIDESTSKIGAWLGWLRIFIQASFVWLLPQNYPKLLVLEYGIDYPGDMDVLLDLVSPNIAVLTAIGSSHLQNFNSDVNLLAVEKAKIASRLKLTETLVYNADDQLVSREALKLKCNRIAFGATANSGAQIVLKSLTESLQLNPTTTLEIHTSTQDLSIIVPVVGKSHENAILAAVAVSEALELDSDLVKKGLASYRAMPGRMNVIAGIRRTILIDDTYNAAPISTIEAVKLLGRFQNLHKVAVLGDMLELGDSSYEFHKEVGKLVASMNLQMLVTVGDLAKEIAESAQENGMDQANVVSFQTSTDAAKFVLDNLVPESVILIKGSQGARMEKVTKELLAEPTAAAQLLVRQYGKWIK